MTPGMEFSATALDHARNPRNVGSLASANGHARITGPCGDTMAFWLYVENARIKRIAFETDGCGSSLACGSMATELAQNASIEEACHIEQQDILDALGGFPVEAQHCALLAANTLHAACRDFRKNDGKNRKGVLHHLLRPVIELFNTLSSNPSK